jgi:hypothetical protein
VSPPLTMVLTPTIPGLAIVADIPALPLPGTPSPITIDYAHELPRLMQYHINYWSRRSMNSVEISAAGFVNEDGDHVSDDEEIAISAQFPRQLSNLFVKKSVLVNY